MSTSLKDFRRYGFKVYDMMIVVSSMLFLSSDVT